MKTLLTPIFCLFALYCFADPPVVEQITTIKAATAELVPQTDKVLIIATELDTTPEYAARFESKAPYAEIYKLVTINGQTYATFPPTTAKPDSKNKFIITGKVNDRFGVSLRTEIPEWFEVVIKPTKPPTDPTDPLPVVGDFATIQKVADEEADKVNDPITRKQLATAYKNVIANFGNKPLEECKTNIVTTRRMILQIRAREAQDKDWEAWKLAVDKKLISDTKDNYIKSYQAVIAGLEAN